MSYYVRIETERGDREIWGVDLERAFRQSLSTPGIGQEVGVRAVGRDPVTVPTTKRDADRPRSRTRRACTCTAISGASRARSFWIDGAKWPTCFAMRPSAPPTPSRQFPELEGSYLQLQMARAGVEQRIESGAAREQFVEHLRAHLAKAIQYGQALEPVRLKARGEEREKTQERDHSPAR